MTPQPTATPTSEAQLPAMFSRYKTWVEQELNRAVPGQDTTELYVLLQYHLGWVNCDGTPVDSPISQGKALRPTLCLFAYEALSQGIGTASPAAAALELIHNFSLIHDDIQDQDEERRHQPTVWRQWGIPKAIVAGNALQSVGDLALLNAAQSDAAPEVVLEVSRLLTESYLEMIQGQCMDLDFESRTDITTEEYLSMIAWKTGSLICSGLVIGALLAGGDLTTVQAFTKLGNCLGRAFQIRDDYLGIWGDEAKTGKPAGNDILRRKKSFPVVYAFGQATGQAREDLLAIYSKDSLTDGDVGRVLEVLDEVGSREYCQKLTEAAAEQAIESLPPETLPSWARD